MNILNQSGIYKITCKPTGKVYVGSAAVLRKRRDKHWGHLQGGKHDNQHLQRAWEKHGADAFSFEVLEVVQDRTLMLEREQHWINALDTYVQGFNMMPATRNERYTLTLSDEQRRVRSERMKQRQSEAGYLDKIAEARRRRYAEDPAFRAEVSAKISQTKKGKKQSSEEVKARMSDGASPYKTPILVMSPEGDVFEYLGVRSFCKEYFPDGVLNAQKRFSMVLQGRANSYKGYRMARIGSPQEAALRAALTRD